MLQAAAILSNNPMFAGNPALQQQMSAMMPQLLQQMQNPQTQQLMSNPEALAAIMQIQQGMDRLRAAAPDLYQSMGLPSLPPNLVPNPAAAGVVLSFQTQIYFYFLHCRLNKHNYSTCRSNNRKHRFRASSWSAQPRPVCSVHDSGWLIMTRLNFDPSPRDHPIVRLQ